MGLEREIEEELGREVSLDSLRVLHASILPTVLVFLRDASLPVGSLRASRFSFPNPWDQENQT